MRLLFLAFLLVATIYSNNSLSQTVPTPEVKATNISTLRSSSNYTKSLEMFRKGQYSLALNLATRVDIDKMSAFEREQLAFISAICKGKLAKANELATLNSYINSNPYGLNRDDARVVAANTYAELEVLDRAKMIVKEVNPNLLSRETLSMYYFLLGYIALSDNDLSLATNNLTTHYNLEMEYNKGIEYLERGEIAKYYLAYIAYREGRYDDAIKEYELLATRNNFPEANIYIMQIYYIQKRYSDILTKGENALKLPIDKTMRAEATRLMGEASFNLSAYSDAIKYIEEYDVMDGKMDRDLYYQLGYSYYKGGDYAKSIDNFKKILSGEDALAQNAYYHLADAYIKSGDKAGAMQAFSMASSFGFDDKMTEDALYNYAKLTYEQAAGNLYSNKIDLLQRYIDTYPATERTNELRSYLLTLYINGASFDKAMAEFAKIKNPDIEIEGAIQRLCYQRGVDRFNDGNYNEAIKLLDKSLSHPVSQKFVALASFWKAEALYKKGDLGDNTIALYNKYITLATPTMREYNMAHYNIGYIHFNNERWSEAVDYFERFVRNYATKDGYREDALQRLGDAKFALKDYTKSQEYYKLSSEVGALNPDYAKFQQAMSEGLMGKDNMKIATLKALSSKSGSMRDEASLELAKTYIKGGNSKSGISVLEQMIKRKGARQYMATALVELGVAYSNSGNEAKALESYKRVVKEYPSSTESKDALAAIKAIYVAQGEAKAYISYIESLGGAGIDAGEKESLSFNALQRQFINGNHKRVISLAKEYKAEYPKGVHRVDVQYYLVEAMILADDANALLAAEELTALPDNQYTLEVLQKTAQMYASNKDYEKQHSALVRIYNLTTNQSKRREVLEALMLLAVSAMQNDSISVASSELVLADKDASETAKDFAYYARGRVAYNRGDYSNAVTELKRSGIPLSKAEGAQAKFLIADALFKLNDLGASEQVILELSNSDTPHQYWVARGFILYGDIYFKRGDAFQAKATYQSIIEGYGKSTDGIINSAKSRLERLLKQEEEK